MSLRHALLALTLAALLPARAPAQILDQIKKPIDHTKQADVSDKTVTFGDLHLETVAQPTHATPATSPLSKGNLQLQQLDLNQVDLKSAEMSTIPEPVLPQGNFSTKRAEADKANDAASHQLDQSWQNAPITNRQIRPLTPKGEEELKKQLNTLHP